MVPALGIFFRIYLKSIPGACTIKYGFVIYLDRFYNKLVPFCCQSLSLARRNTIAYYIIRKLRIL